MVGNWSLWASLGALAAPVLAVQDEAVVELPVRITQVLPDGRFEIDRGANMWLAGGDRVVLLSRDGRSWTGRIAEVREFDAVVELFETGADLAVGSQGTAYLPKARTTAGQPVPKGRDTAPTGPVLHDPWERLDEEWTRSDPLLARIAPVHPADRAVRDGGRLYGILEPRWSSEEGRSETWFRVGGHYWMENPWGRGGRFEVDGEFNRLSYHLPFPEDHRDQNLRVDRLSYALGGTRQDPWRYEVGRFLMYGMPELGLVDGGSVHLRRPNGDLMGVSMGWMPEPDPDQTPGHDFQISAFYRWSLDTFERYTAALAVQKTWHQGAQDRDLIIGRMDYAPLEGWRYHGSAWIDWYGNDELVKDSGVDLTRLRLEGSREWQGSGACRRVTVTKRFPTFCATNSASRRRSRCRNSTCTGCRFRGGSSSPRACAARRGRGSGSMMATAAGTSRSAARGAIRGSSGAPCRPLCSWWTASSPRSMACARACRAARPAPTGCCSTKPAKAAKSPCRATATTSTHTASGAATASPRRRTGTSPSRGKRPSCPTTAICSWACNATGVSDVARETTTLDRLLAVSRPGGLHVAGSGDIRLQGWWRGLGPVMPHDSFPADCSLCHLGGDWNTIRADFEFDHTAETGYALEGAARGGPVPALP
ncbi:MAG: hypothetical protein R3F17_14660 [Planctomycetota bacterium]